MSDKAQTAEGNLVDRLMAQDGVKLHQFSPEAQRLWDASYAKAEQPQPQPQQTQARPQENARPTEQPKPTHVPNLTIEETPDHKATGEILSNTVEMKQLFAGLTKAAGAGDKLTFLDLVGLQTNHSLSPKERLFAKALIENFDTIGKIVHSPKPTFDSMGNRDSLSARDLEILDKAEHRNHPGDPLTHSENKSTWVVNVGLSAAAGAAIFKGSPRMRALGALVGGIGGALYVGTHIDTPERKHEIDMQYLKIEKDYDRFVDKYKAGH